MWGHYVSKFTVMIFFLMCYLNKFTTFSIKIIYTCILQGRKYTGMILARK
jgi:hypothetical protein